MNKPYEISILESMIGSELYNTKYNPNNRFIKLNRSYDVDIDNNVIALNLGFIEIFDTSILARFTHLISLDLSNTGIKNLSFLQNLKKLLHLNLSFNNILNFEATISLNLITLNLGNNNLENVFFLSSFRNLEYLNLESNKFNDIIPLFELRNLKVLDLSFNRFDNLHIIRSFKKLKILNLADTGIDNIDFAKHLKLINKLNLSYNQIEDISALQDFYELTDLDLSYNKISDIKPLSKLVKIQNLKLSFNEISDISYIPNNHLFFELLLNGNEIYDLSSLNNIEVFGDFFISQNLITDLSPLYNSIKQGKINHLTAYENPLSYPPIEIIFQGEFAIVDWFDENLKLARKLVKQNLENKNPELDLGNCCLTDLSMIPELFDCEHLEILILSNIWPKYSIEKKKWEERKSSNSGLKNKIYNIPETISRLKNLRILICGGDWKTENGWNRGGLRSMANLKYLDKLEILNISNHKISKLTNLRNFKKLKVLHANNNEIESVYSLGTSNVIDQLYLSNNLIKSLKFLRHVKKISALDLHGNKITDLRPIRHIIERIGVFDEKWLVNSISINKNPLQIPSIEIVRIGAEAVLKILDQTSPGNYFRNRDIKLILVGNSESGKTTLVNFLCKNDNVKTKPPYTLWMNEIVLKLHNVNVRIFDFGGHDFYHDTHHIFFSNNSIYLLLWEEKNNKIQSRLLLQEDSKNTVFETTTQDYPIKYWLESIEFFIKEKKAKNFDFKIYKENNEDLYSSDVLLIQNKVQTHKEINFINNKYFKKKYPFVYEFMNMDIHSGRNVTHFELLLKEILDRAPILNARYPKYYEIIKEELKEYEGKPIITIDEFADFCNSFNNVDITQDDVMVLVQYLNTIGQLLYVKTNPQFVYVDKPKIRAYIVDLFSELYEMKGEFDLDYLKLKIINEEDSNNIIKLMLDFKMIFEHPNNLMLDNKKFIAPLYLPEEPSELINLFVDNKIKPYRRFEYKGFIHKNVILNIFSTYGKNILNDDHQKTFYYWKNGLIINDQVSSEKILIKFNIGNDKGNAFIDMFKLNKKIDTDFSNNVISYIKEINTEYNGFKERVTIDGKYFINLDKLIQEANNNEKIIEIDKYDYETRKRVKKRTSLYNFNQFLPIYMQGSLKKAIISYSKKDLRLIEEFKATSLGPLISDELIDKWHCTELVVGQLWNDEIEKRIKECDIAFIMISSASMNNNYIKNKEIKILIERFNDENEINKPLIIPIILKPYHWIIKNSIYNLGQFSALPYTAKPVNDFKDREVAWFIIGECVRIAIEKKVNFSTILGKDYWKDYWYEQEPDQKVREYFVKIIEGQL